MKDKYDREERFMSAKADLIYSDKIAPKSLLDVLIREGKEIGFLSSMDELIRYRDHYYPKEEK